MLTSKQNVISVKTLRLRPDYLLEKMNLPKNITLIIFALTFTRQVHGQKKELILSSGVFSSTKSVSDIHDYGFGKDIYDHKATSTFALNPSFRKYYDKYFIEYGFRRLSFSNYETAFKQFYNYWPTTLTINKLQIEVVELNAEIFYGINTKVYTLKNINLHLGIESYLSLNPIQFKFGNDTIWNVLEKGWYNRILVSEIGSNIIPRLSYKWKDIFFEFALVSRLSFIQRYSYFFDLKNTQPRDLYFFNFTFSPQFNIGINLNYFKK